MKRYYVETTVQDKVKKEHQVHKEGCSHLPHKSSIEYIGEFDNCLDAVVEAARHYNSVNGCKYCCPHYHKILS